MTELPTESNIRVSNLRGPRAFPSELRAPLAGSGYIPTAPFLAALIYFTGECGATTVAEAVWGVSDSDRSGSKALKFIVELGPNVSDDDKDLALAISAYFRETGYSPDLRGSFAAATDLYATRMCAGLVHPVLGGEVICWHGDRLRREDSDVDNELRNYDAAIDQWLVSDAAVRFLTEAELLGLAKSHLRRFRPTIPWTTEAP